MGFVKYVDLVNNHLMENQFEFIKQLHDCKDYKGLSYSCLRAVVHVITECIEYERYKIHFELMKKKVNLKQRIEDGNSQMLLALDEMKSLKLHPDHQIDVATLVDRNFYYKGLLNLFGHLMSPISHGRNKSPNPVDDLVSQYFFPDSYRNNEEKIYQVTKSIFDIIERGTRRSMLFETEADISKEEWAASTSTDLGDSMKKEVALKKIQILEERKRLAQSSNSKPGSKKRVLILGEGDEINGKSKTNKKTMSSLKH